MRLKLYDKKGEFKGSVESGSDFESDGGVLLLGFIAVIVALLFIYSVTKEAFTNPILFSIILGVAGVGAVLAALFELVLKQPVKFRVTVILYAVITYLLGLAGEHWNPSLSVVILGIPICFILGMICAAIAFPIYKLLSIILNCKWLRKIFFITLIIAGIIIWNNPIIYKVIAGIGVFLILCLLGAIYICIRNEYTFISANNLARWGFLYRKKDNTWCIRPNSKLYRGTAYEYTFSAKSDSIYSDFGEDEEKRAINFFLEKRIVYLEKFSRNEWKKIKENYSEL